MTGVTVNLSQTIERIRAAASRSGRENDPITLVAVSKKHPVSTIRAAMQAGQRDFGENYVQEAEAKILAVKDSGAIWHFIGRVQSNKTRTIAAHFDWVHTIDRARVAERLNQHRGHYQAPLQVCIQVREGDEPNRPGVSPADLGDLAEAIRTLPRLRLRGLMCMAPDTDDYATQYRVFDATRQLMLAQNAIGNDMDTLSMGMTGDLEAAIAAGSTCVRVGTAIFGPRPES